jgi:hypothetical protein
MKERAKFGVKIDLKKMLKDVNEIPDQETPDQETPDQENSLKVEPAN